MKPRFALNGLNPLARTIALQLRSSWGLLRMETVRRMAHEREESRFLAEALRQLAGYGVARLCAGCDSLISENTRHALGCQSELDSNVESNSVRKGGRGESPEPLTGGLRRPPVKVVPTLKSLEKKVK